jgi:hypothetical protein
MKKAFKKTLIGLAILFALSLGFPILNYSEEIKGNFSDFVTGGPWVDVRKYASLNAAVASSDTLNKLILVTDAETLTASLTVQYRTIAILPNAGTITKASTYTITFSTESRFVCDPLWQAFIGFSPGDVTFGKGAVKEIYSEWWQANTTPGTTDMTVAIQSAVTAAAAISVKVKFLSGTYKITDTIYVANGLSLTAVALEGSIYGLQSVGGTLIDASSFLDRPAIAIQGARGITISNLIIIGGNTAPYALGGNETDNEADYITPGATYGRYNPYAGIAIDPYLGSKPTPHYPGTYGKAPSSLVHIENCHIRYFVVGIVNHPCNSNTQGDGIHIVESTIDYCEYGISNGGTQSRDMQIINCNVAHCRTLFANPYGTTAGAPPPKIVGGQGGGCYRVFDVPLSDDLFSCSNFYTEAIQIIGSIGSSATASNTCGLVSGCTFIFNNNAIIPKIANLIIFGQVKFDTCIIYPKYGIFNVDGIGSIKFDNCNFYSHWNDEFYIARTYNYNNVDAFIEMSNCSFVTDPYSLVSNTISMNSFGFTSPLPAHLVFSPATRMVFDRNGPYKYIRGELHSQIIGGDLISSSWTDASTILITLDTGQTSQFAVGDILYWQANPFNGIYYFTLPALQVTNIDAVNKQITAICMFDPNNYNKSWVPDGLKVFICHREWAPGIICTGDTHTNTTIDNVVGVTALRVGDFIKGTDIPDKTRIIDITGTTVTISKAATGSHTGVDLYFAKLVAL